MILRILLGTSLMTGCISSGPHTITTLPPVPVASDGYVRIAADDGDVHVVTADVAQVEMEVDSAGYDVERDLDLSMVVRNGEVEIIAKERDRLRIFDFTSRSLRVDVRIPRNASLAVTAADGSVDVAAVEGGVAITTSDGDVNVRDARGAIRLYTRDGSVRARGLDGAVEASSSDGDVELDGRFDALSVETRDGSATVTVRPGSQVGDAWRLAASDGDVTLNLPGDIAAHIDATSDDGDVYSTLPLSSVGSSHATGDINGGGPPITVRTRDGSIRLLQN